MRRKRSKALASLCVVLAVILGLLIIANVYMDRVLSMIRRVPQSVETLSSSELYLLENQTDPLPQDFSGQVIEPSDIIWSEQTPASVAGDHLINILLIGLDRREDEDQQRSDAMILCTVNTETKTLTMTSFLRDLYVQIPGYRDNRLNAAYAIGGMTLLDETLEKNFGVEIDGNIEVDFAQFEQIIDLMGGVDITLTSEEAAYLNSSFGCSLQEGENQLNGAEALAYSRIRYIGTDFGRADRQRTVLASLVEACRDLRLTQMYGLLKSLFGMITTDMTDSQLIGYAIDCFPLLKDLRIQTQYIPAEGTYQFASVRGMAVILADMEANRQLLRETIME